ncbi:hypothetical protein P154DRAFT_520932 [Amniculicola lignicola CBS 123094]|uniref:Ecp2 effector protein domain-containing protein n=1 Tax=Amniculicola lignicola CBS 123094 TaxID=1392246 RepID=A0A6A5WNJ5_9PLEO|nr:hypothetical protein P154DRAFT_520932 [Amniculicola lignicola CBS 123094]
MAVVSSIFFFLLHSILSFAQDVTPTFTSSLGVRSDCGNYDWHRNMEPDFRPNIIKRICHCHVAHGGKDGCFTSIIHPEDNDGDLTCWGVGKADPEIGTGVTVKEGLPNIASFCQRVAKDHATQSRKEGVFGEHYQLVGHSSATLEAFYDQNCETEAESYTIDERSCLRFLSRIAQECKTNNGVSEKTYGGKVVDTSNCKWLQHAGANTGNTIHSSPASQA